MVVDKDLSSIMQIIDENKCNMSDGDYIKVCRSMKRLHMKLKGKTILDIKIPLPGCIGFLIVSKGLINITRAFISRN